MYFYLVDSLQVAIYFLIYLYLVDGYPMDAHSLQVTIYLSIDISTYLSILNFTATDI